MTSATHWPLPVSHSPSAVQPTVTLDLTVSVLPPSCGRCEKQATCAYSYGVSSEYACDGHDPTKQPGWLTGAVPWNFSYRSLNFSLAVPYSTGHLAIGP